MHLIDEVEHLRDETEYKEIVLLAHLQHNYAKTGLIDYTFNPLITLWFACEIKSADEQTNGVVCCIGNSQLVDGFESVGVGTKVKDLFNKTNKDGEETSNKSDTVYMFKPPHINRRIEAQQSVFLFSPRGVVDKERHIRITIPSGCKKEILKELSYIGISRKTLFPDFHGLGEWFALGKAEVYDYYITKAEEALQNLKYGDAINWFEKAIELSDKAVPKKNMEIATVYNKKALAYYCNGDYDDALKTCEKALSELKRLGESHYYTVYIYSIMANSYRRKGIGKEKADAKEDYEKALNSCEKSKRIFSIIEKF